MTITAPQHAARRCHARRDTAMRLAATEYQRFLDAAPRARPWRLGAANRVSRLGCARHGRRTRWAWWSWQPRSASNAGRCKLARSRGGVFIDALTGTSRHCPSVNALLLPEAARVQAAQAMGSLAEAQALSP